jgi:RNA polymerase sigma-70 factor, ECF subfamily
VSRLGLLEAQKGESRPSARSHPAVNLRQAVILALPRLAAVEGGSDGELVARALAGERIALQLLYRRHVAPVTERVTRLLARSGEAEDVVQDAFVAAFAELGRLNDPSRFGPWLMRIAVHQAQRRFRRRRLLARLGLDRGQDDARLEQVAAPELSPEERIQLSRLDQALGELPVPLRLAWMLRHVEGCELAEVAEQCRCSLATVKRRITRADEQLRARVHAGTDLEAFSR